LRRRAAGAAVAVPAAPWSDIISDDFHAIVWPDHHEAKAFHLGITDVERVHDRAIDPDHHIHHKANPADSGHAPTDDDYYRRVAESIADAGAVLITGPASPKTGLLTYITRHDSALLKRISRVQTVDHPNDGTLLALAREYFNADDRMHPQR
jgi:hypothetical protein